MGNATASMRRAGIAGGATGCRPKTWRDAAGEPVLQFISDGSRQGETRSGSIERQRDNVAPGCKKDIEIFQFVLKKSSRSVPVAIPHSLDLQIPHKQVKQTEGFI